MYLLQFFFLILNQSEERKKPTTFISKLRLIERDRGDFITLSLFSKPALWLADLSQVFCVKCEGNDNPLLPAAAPTEPGRLFNARRPTSLFGFFSLYQMSDFAQIFTHSAGGGCFFFQFSAFFPQFSVMPHHITVQYMHIRSMVEMQTLGPRTNYIKFL